MAAQLYQVCCASLCCRDLIGCESGFFYLDPFLFKRKRSEVTRMPMLHRILYTTLIVSGLASLTLAEPALAQSTAGDEVSTHGVFILNSLLFLIGGCLVMFMACGFCMLEAGLVRSKNVTTQLTKNVGLFSIAAVGYYLVGYTLMYPGGSWAIDGVMSSLIGQVAEMEPVGVAADSVADLSYASVGSDYVFQLMFCAATASIVSGAVAERMKIWPFLVFSFILTALIYPLQASWKWGGGFLDALGFLDFAGSTVVHSVGGWAALAGVLVLGPRLGKYKGNGVVPMPGSNLSLAALGTFILWLGWFGFNGGSQLAMGTVSDVADVSRIFANTNAGAAGGSLAVIIISQLMYKKLDLTMILNGALAGLVSITAEPLTPSLGGATLIGAVGGGLVVLAVPMLDRFKIDDVVGAIPVHLVAGIWGTLAVCITNPDASVSAQLIGIGVIGAFSFLASSAVWFALDKAVGIRVSKDTEMMGLDSLEIGQGTVSS